MSLSSRQHVVEHLKLVENVTGATYTGTSMSKSGITEGAFKIIFINIGGVEYKFHSFRQTVFVLDAHTHGRPFKTVDGSLGRHFEALDQDIWMTTRGAKIMTTQEYLRLKTTDVASDASSDDDEVALEVPVAVEPEVTAETEVIVDAIISEEEEETEVIVSEEKEADNDKKRRLDRKTIPADVKKRMLSRFSALSDADGIVTCPCCLTTKARWNRKCLWEYSHVLAHANGGAEDEFNLRLLCISCNREMSTLNAFDYKGQQHPGKAWTKYMLTGCPQ